MSKLVDHMSRYKRTATELDILANTYQPNVMLGSTAFNQFSSAQRECPVCAVEKTCSRIRKKKADLGLV